MNGEGAARLTELGKRLRELRTKRGWSLEQVTERTHIPLRHLAEIEAGDFSRMPAPVYARGFVRTYARTLDLDEALTLKELDEAGIVSATEGRMALEASRGHPPTDRVEAEDAPEPAERPAGPAQGIPREWLVLAGAVLLIGALLGLMVRGVVRLTRSATVAEPPPSPFNIQPAAKPRGDRPAVAESGADRPAAALGAVTVSVTAIQDCWIGFQLDGRPADEAELKAGQVRGFTGASSVRLLIGNAPGVRILGPRGPVLLPAGTGKVAHLRFSRTAVERLPVPAAPSSTVAR